MNTCKEYEALHPDWKDQIQTLIKKMCGKSYIADIIIEPCDLMRYEFKVTVCKFNKSGTKGWATIGYLKNDISRGGIWRLSYRPRLSKGEKSEAGRTGVYG